MHKGYTSEKIRQRNQGTMNFQNENSENAGATNKYSSEDRKARRMKVVTREEMLGDAGIKATRTRKLLDLVSQLQKFELSSVKTEYDAFMTRCNLDSMREKEDKYFAPISSNRHTRDDNEDYLKKYRTLEKEKEACELALKMENEKLQMELNGKNTDIEQMKEDMSTLRTQLDEHNRRQGVYSRDSSRADQLMRQNDEIKNKLQEAEKRLKKAKEEHDGWLETMNTMKTESDKEIHQLKIEIERLRKKEEEFRKRLKQEEKRTLEAEAAKSEAFTRLSREMGTKLNDNNPAIADLSDPNRATKLAEMYNEIYDNEWTDALEILETYRQEQISIGILLNIVKRVYEFCKKKAEEEMEYFETTFFAQNMGRQGTLDNEANRNKKTIIKMLKDFRKTFAENRVETMYKEYASRASSDKSAAIVPDYVKKVVKVCWLMSVQDPPVVLGQDAKVGGTLNTDAFKQYTQTGTIVSYTVWLPLYLHEGGPLLSKGVAQPIASRIRSAPAKHEFKTDTTSPKERNRKMDKHEAPPMQPKYAWEKTTVVPASNHYGYLDSKDYRADRGYVQETARTFDSHWRHDYGTDHMPHLYTTGQHDFGKTYNRPTQYLQNTVNTNRSTQPSWKY